MNIVIAAPFCSLPGEAYFNRFLYLAQLLSAEHRVTLLTSRFRHYDKSFRAPRDEPADAAPMIRLLDEPGYRHNVSLRRLYSHHRWVQALARETENWRPGSVDVVYSAYPLIASNLLLGRRKRQLGYKLVLDVQDVWPESFSAVLPPLAKLPPRLLPFARRADAAYAAADALAAVSHTYLQRALAANPLPPERTAAVYIGGDAGLIDHIPPAVLPGGAVRLFYLGTISHSYDLATVCTGVQQLNGSGQAVELHIIGGGGDEAALKARFAGPSVIFHGFQPYERAIALAKACHIAVNPIHGHAAQSITNKLSDYMLLHKPVLNSQTGAETAQVLQLTPHEHYRSGHADSFVEAAGRLLAHRPFAATDAEAVDKLFRRSRSYPRLQELIESLQD